MNIISFLFIKFLFLFFYFPYTCSLRQIAYISHTTSHYGFEQDEIQDILLKSRKFNFQNDITGILLYHDTHIFQIIESDEDVINQVMSRISADIRHRGIFIIMDRQIEVRSFQNWAMMFRDLQYTKDMEQWAKETELLLFNEITYHGRSASDASDTSYRKAELAQNTALKLVKIYEKMFFEL